MTMRITATVVIFIGSVMLMRADQLVESVQQALKDASAIFQRVQAS